MRGSSQSIAGVVGELLREALTDIDEPLEINAMAAASAPPAHDLCNSEVLGQVLKLY